MAEERVKNLIVFVDDNLLSRKLAMQPTKPTSLKNLLEKDGYQLLVFNGTKDFYNNLDSFENRLALIVSDYDMRGSDGNLGVNGNEFLEDIRSRGLDIPFIIASDNPLEMRAGELNSDDLRRLNAEYIDTGSKKPAELNGGRVYKEIKKLLGLDATGGGMGSLYLRGADNTVSNKNKVYNDIRQVLLNRFNVRGKEIAFNQTKQEILFHRAFAR